MAWKVEDEEIGDINLERGGRSYVVREVKTLKAMGALITTEADSMSALRSLSSWMTRLCGPT